MATREEILKFLESDNWEVIELLSQGETQVLKTTWSFDDGRAQVVWATVNSTFHQILSPFARVGDVSAERALNMNQTLLGVTIAIDHYCLAAVGLNSHFSPQEFKVLENLVGQFADKIEESSGGGDVL